MKTQKNKLEIMDNPNTQVKEYQTPIFNEFGSLTDLTAGGQDGLGDVDFTGTEPG